MSGNETSKYIALILRHKPEVIDITLDEHGWANVDELLEGINKTQALSFEELKKTYKQMKNSGTPSMRIKR